MSWAERLFSTVIIPEFMILGSVVEDPYFSKVIEAIKMRKKG